jgi:DNA-binding CsgD family transcriptional regulator
MTEARLRRAAEGIHRVGADCSDGRVLRELLLREIARHVDFQAYAWVLTDPETEVGADPLADVPTLPELPRLIRLKYSTEVNRWTGLTASVACLHAVTDGHLERALVWRQLWSKYQVSDVASVVFRDRFGCWAFLDLWRTGAAPPFAAAEVDYLAAIAPKITHRLRLLQAANFDAANPIRERPGPVVMVLSPELEVRAQSADTDAYLRALVPAEGDRRPIPAGAYNVGAQLIARELGVDDHPPRARVCLSPGTWLSLSAARMTGPLAAAADIAVTVEPVSATERMDLFSRAHGLSRREAELLAALSRGSDTRDLASRLHVSENTIQDHLKSIFAKTGARSRGALLARALGS